MLLNSSRSLSALFFLLFSLCLQARAQSSYWVANIQRQGVVPFGTNASYPVYRNVMTYGAKGDGKTDDTQAINLAISDGKRCGLHCDSSTTTPAIVYFPPGTYMVSAPIVQYYYTQLIGDAITLPIIRALPNFDIGQKWMIDSDVYIPGGFGATWYYNTNNFYRQIRNFVFDITPLGTVGVCLHWQVAQATSLQNIVFNMTVGGSNNKQQGIFMDNGSGGWMSDLIFHGGFQAAFFGNQQFTSRNLTFYNSMTAIKMNYDWVWNLKSIFIYGATIGIDMSTGGTDSQAVSGVALLDSIISAATGILTNYIPGRSYPPGAGTLYMENIDFRGTNVAVTNSQGNLILNGGTIVQSFAQGSAYTTAGVEVLNGQYNATTCTISNATGTGYTAQATRIQQQLAPMNRPANLLDNKGYYFERSRPQYETLPSNAFLSAKRFGCKGDGVTDDTKCISNFLTQANGLGQIAYFDHGAYLMFDTVIVPVGSRITGECWPMIMATGSNFQDQNNPKPMWQIGNPGDVGTVEMSDLMLQTQGPAHGAIILQWNVAESTQGSAGMWDVQWRMGGSAGTQLQSDLCSKNPGVSHAANPACEASFLLLHVTSQATIYMENTWGWVADHELDRTDHNQTDIYNGRGFLFESANGPIWLYGTASEHSTLYNYQISNPKNVYGGVMQTEVAYFQGNPNSLSPFTPQASWGDPLYANCTVPNCYKTWALRLVNSSEIYIYGAGFYSFFENWSTGCLDGQDCSRQGVDVLDSSDIYIWVLTTVGTSYMVSYDGYSVVPESPNSAGFTQTIVLFEAPPGK